MFSRIRNHMLSGILAASAVILLLLASSATRTSSADESTAFFFINSDGDLVRPEGYREWVYVGTPLTPNSLNPPEAPFPEFHNVYIDPASWSHYKATGEFREGTILIKELVSVGSNVAVSGNGFFMGDFIGLEATIKSSKYFPDEPGNWAYFSFGHSLPLAETAEPFPTSSCNGCHEVSAAQDFVFTQFYPVLRAAAPAATAGPTTMDPVARNTLMAAMSEATSVIREPRAETGTSPGPVPTNSDDLFAYLVDREYESLVNRESELHPSRGPHAKFGNPVRVFMSDDLVASLEAGNASHPAGSSIVKELYLPNSTTLEGWAVMVKTQDETDDGKGWFWYEVLSTTDPTKFGGGVDPGNGVRLCTGCHLTGNDYVLSTFPLK